jgi:hypothetical protein
MEPDDDDVLMPAPSTSSRGEAEPTSAVGSCRPAWATDVDKILTPEDLLPIASEHRETILHLCDKVDALHTTVPRLAHKINSTHSPQIQDNRRNIRDLQRFQDQVGSVVDLVATHGSLARAVTHAFEVGETSAEAVRQLKEQLQAFADELAECSDRTELSRDSLLSLINRVSVSASKRADALEHRVGALESTPESTGRRVPIGAPLAGSGGLTPDTSFEQVNVGSTTVDLTLNILLNQIQTLEARVQSVSERSRNTGVVFHRLAFGSEADFGYWYLTNNPSGEGPSAFVDMISIWSFAASESGTTEWLTDLHRAQSVGFKVSPDTIYAHSMTTRYPRVFVGKVDTILSSQTIKMLESVDAWRGNGMGDGFKERLLDQLQYAVQSHAGYCEDYLPEGGYCQRRSRNTSFKRSPRIWTTSWPC